MVSQLSDNEEETGNGPWTDYKRCSVFEFERSDSGSDSGEENSASEDGDDEGCDNENGEVDQGSRNGGNDCL